MKWEAPDLSAGMSQGTGTAIPVLVQSLFIGRDAIVIIVHPDYESQDLE